MPVSVIVEFTFRKCNAYFIDRWKLANQLALSGVIWGRAAQQRIDMAEEQSVTQVAEEFDPALRIWQVRAAGGTTLGGERYDGRNYIVDLTVGSCT